MQTKTYNVYKFNELDEKGKQKALDNLRDINTDYEWWDSVYENAATIGLRLKSFDLDRSRHATGEFMVLGGGEQCAGLIMAEHGEQTATYKTAAAYLKELEVLHKKYPEHESYYENDANKYEEYTEEYGILESDFLHDRLEDYSIILQNEYEYLCSDEAIIETIEANDYDFTSDGKLD